jgi:hypothetical protein
MSDVNDGNFYLSRARCNRRTVLLQPQSAILHVASIPNINGKVSQVVVDYADLLPLQSGTGVGSFQMFSDVTRGHSSDLVPYHKPIFNIDLSLSQNEALMVLDVTPGSDNDRAGNFPAFSNVYSDGGYGVIGQFEGVGIGKTSWNGMVHGNLILKFALTGSSPLPAEGKGIKVTIYLE